MSLHLLRSGALCYSQKILGSESMTMVLDSYKCLSCFSNWGYSVISLNSATCGKLRFSSVLTVLGISDKVLSWVVLSDQSCLPDLSDFECVGCSLRILMHN